MNRSVATALAPYSPNDVEGEFSEVHSQLAKGSKKTHKPSKFIAHSSPIDNNADKHAHPCAGDQ
jgi:hypothetical protein